MMVSKTIKYLGVILTKWKWKICTMKTIFCWKKLKTTQMEKYSVCGLEKLILLKCPYYPKPSVDSVQSLYMLT